MLSWRQSSAGATSAIAIIEITGEEPEIAAAIDRFGLGPIAPGGVALREMMGIDRGLVARFSDTSLTLFPHGSAPVVRAIGAALSSAGIPRSEEVSARLEYPETQSEIEARMLRALAGAASPLAIDVLLDQPRRWAAAGESGDIIGAGSALERLLTPPLVVAIGPANVGKSSLLNALAGRGLALVADEPGTTRDHVGAHLDLAGLVTRYIDMPGVRSIVGDGEAGAIEAQAVQLGAAMVRSADLILSCGDITAPPLPALPGAPGSILTVALRVDLGVPPWAHDVAVSALTGENLSELVAAVRDRLIPPEVLSDPRPWRFWAD